MIISIDVVVFITCVMSCCLWSKFKWEW